MAWAVRVRGAEEVDAKAEKALEAWVIKTVWEATAGLMALVLEQALVWVGVAGKVMVGIVAGEGRKEQEDEEGVRAQEGGTEARAGLYS